MKEATRLGRRLAPWAVGLAALALLFAGLLPLQGSAEGLEITTERLGQTPVTLFRPVGSGAKAASPVVLIAHGFAGSQQLMQPFALTLARNGYTAITFDFPGHGRNPTPMRGGLVDPDASQRTLLAAMKEMGAFAAERSARQRGGGAYAVLGHSMASDIVVRHAQSHPAEVVATVGVSLFAPSITAETPPNSPRNLLVVSGALEPGVMATEALRVVSRVAGPGAALDTTYGRFDAGTARRATLAPGVEHISVLYSAATQAAALAWLDAAFAVPPRDPSRDPSRLGTFIDSRGPALGAVLLGVVGLAWPLSLLLPRVGVVGGVGLPPSPRRRRWWARRGDAPLALLPAALTPLLLWKLPTDVLPLLLGDYLVLHFAVYGLLTMLGLRLQRRAWPRIGEGRGRAFVLATLLVAVYGLVAVGAPVDRYVFNVWPEAGRWPLIAAMALGTLPWFLADECFTRSPEAALGAYFVSKVCFLFSLVVAIALNPGRLFFLAILVPAILLLFAVYGLFSRWAMRATGHPAVGALANALAFAAFIAVTFPLVS